MYLFFDTETNGKIKNFGAKMTDVDNFPRVTQLAFALFDRNENLIRKHNFLIKPDGWTIPDEKFFRDNGMSTERNIINGQPIFIALDTFIKEINNGTEYLIAHNIDFDYPTLGAEMIRFGLRTNKQTKKICTMKSSTEFCKLPGRSRHEFKYPKLEELHKILFNKNIEDAHDALGDVVSTARCFFELQRLGIIKI